VCLFGAAKSSQPDLIYLQNQQALLARMATHNQKKLRKPLPFGARTFHNKRYIFDKILTYLNNYMLAENEMNEQQ
jgi:hypothetical protein